MRQWWPSLSPMLQPVWRGRKVLVVFHLSFTSLYHSLLALVVKRRPLHTPVPVFDLGVLHHVFKCLQALHYSEDAEHSLQTKQNNKRGVDLKTLLAQKKEKKKIPPHIWRDGGKWSQKAKPICVLCDITELIGR